MLSKHIMGIILISFKVIIFLKSEPCERLDRGILIIFDSFKKELYQGVYSPKGTNFLLL